MLIAAVLVVVLISVVGRSAQQSAKAEEHAAGQMSPTATVGRAGPAPRDGSEFAPTNSQPAVVRDKPYTAVGVKFFSPSATAVASSKPAPRVAGLSGQVQMATAIYGNGVRR